MRKMFKFVALLLSFPIVFSFETNVFSADTVYDDCDVNHDGDVDVFDAVMVSQYLSGSLFVSDYERFDTNKSLTVDQADVKKILSKVSFDTYSAKYWKKSTNSTISFPTVSNPITREPNASESTSRSYRRYSYTNSQELTSYTLTPNAVSISNESSQEPRQIIGTDDRVLSLGDENTGIVRIDDIGTGFIVGDHIIATAAHNVYERGHGGGHFKTDISTIKPYNLNGTLSTTVSFTPVEVHVPTDFCYESSAGSRPYDYALITVSDDLSGYMHFSFGTTYNLSATNYSNIPLYLLGPGISVGDTPTNNLYYSQGNIISHSTATSTGLLYYNCDSMHGDSGAPIYTITRTNVGGQISYYYTVVAIHAYNDSDTNNPSIWNAGSRITKYQLQFFNESANTFISY